MIVLVGGEKGGTGKSTLAINLATAHALKKKEVLIIDADKQGTTNEWVTLRNELEIEPKIPCIQKFGKQIHKEIQSLQEKYETIIIDAGGRDSVELRASMLVADVFLTPIRASQNDIWTLGKLIDLINDAQIINPELNPKIVIAQAPTNPSITEINEIQELLSDEDYQVFSLTKTIIRDRVIYRHSIKEGLSVLEFSPSNEKAKEEVKMLHKEVFK